jgi:hypothetical protein
MVMTPSVRARVVDAMVDIMPATNPCYLCSVNGCIEDPRVCRTELAERLLAVIERERGEAL